MSEAARAEVHAAIVAAFAGVQREEGVSLHEADALDNYATTEERARARALDTDQNWTDAPEAELERMYWAVGYLDAKGFRYYLPAYLTWALRALPIPGSNTTTLDSVLFVLSPSSELSGPDPLFPERVSLLSLEQCQAVAQFLRYLARFGDGYEAEARQALGSYWGRFAQGGSANRGESALELREGDNFLEVRHLETIPPGAPTAGDLRLSVRVSSNGFSGMSDSVWVDAESIRRFVEELEEVEARRFGAARLEAMGPPGESWLEIRAVDRAGHLAVLGRVSCWQFPQSRSEGFRQQVDFGFEFCPSRLPALLSAFQRLGSNSEGPCEGPDCAGR